MKRNLPLSPRGARIIYAQVHLLDAIERLRHLQGTYAEHRTALAELSRLPQLPNEVWPRLFATLQRRDRRLLRDLTTLERRVAAAQSVMRTPDQSPRMPAGVMSVRARGG